ncbi:HB2L protein, partial [Hippolais icterina]|nr:HB2L protein [Hippolais icterina]
PSVSILLEPLSFQPSSSCLLWSVMDFCLAKIQLQWFQGQQELSWHVVATEVVPNGDWTHQLLVMLETSAPWHGVTSSCQVEHSSLEHPLS